MTWSFDEQIGEQRLIDLLTVFYDRLFDDVMIGFFFIPFNKSDLIASQLEWLRANLGDKSGTYTGRNIREAHQNLPILVGHFDRRHTILKEVLAQFELPSQVVDDWLALDQSLRDLVVRTGGTARDTILKGETNEDPQSE